MISESVPCMTELGFVLPEGTDNVMPNNIIHFSVSREIFEHLISLGFFFFLPWQGRIILSFALLGIV